MTSKNNTLIKSISAGILASTMAVTALSISPTPANIFSLSKANAEAVRVEAVQAPGFADVVEAVSPAVVSVRVEQFIDAKESGRKFRFDRRNGEGNRGNRGNVPKFFRDHPQLEEFFNEYFNENRKSDDDNEGKDRSGKSERKDGEKRFGNKNDERGSNRGKGREDDDRRFSKRDNDKPSPRQKRRRGMSQGSGFFVSDDGYIVTNNHVIANGSKFTVIMHDGKEYEAKLVGADKRSDLAVLKIDEDETKFTYVAFGEKDPRIGDWVVAVGNPFGLGGTVTSGIVSARGREIGASRYDDFIQIDAAVNKGNSGGPAFNLNGEVIGVNTAIFSPSGGNVGIAFAIPADTANEIVTDLIENGKVVRGWLGVQIQPVTSDIAESLGLSSAEGAIVTEPQEGSPAQVAGIQSGDVITAVDQQPVKSPRELARMIADYEPESDVVITVWRDGQAQDLTVNLGTLKEIASAKSNKQQKFKKSKVRVGLELEANPDGDGVIVVDVLPQSSADEKGIKVGDILKGVNGEQVKTPQEVAKIIKEAAKLGRKAVLFQVQRSGRSSFIAVPLKKG